MNIPHQLIVHLPELITTIMSTTPIMTTTLKTTTTLPTTTLVTTNIPTPTLVTTTIPTTTLVTTTPTTKLPTLRTTLMKRTSQPIKTPINSPHVSSMFDNPNTKTTTTQKEETLAILGTDPFIIYKVLIQYEHFSYYIRKDIHI